MKMKNGLNDSWLYEVKGRGSLISGYSGTSSGLLVSTLGKGSFSPSEQVLAAESMLRSRGTEGSSWTLTTSTGIGDEEGLADRQSGVDTLSGVASRWFPCHHRRV